MKNKKEIVLERLRKTIDAMNTLEENEFDYSEWVTKGENGCGTVCCVAGWYPKWFPESKLEWVSLKANVFLKDGTETIEDKLCEYHGLHINFIEYLFLGVSFATDKVVFECAPMQPTLHQVIERFELMYKYLEGKDLNYYKFLKVK